MNKAKRRMLCFHCPEMIRRGEHYIFDSGFAFHPECHASRLALRKSSKFISLGIRVNRGCLCESKPHCTCSEEVLSSIAAELMWLEGSK